MRTYTLESMTDNELKIKTVKAKNIAEAISESGFFLRPVFRYEGRKGEWNEYVEFDPRRTNGVVFIAQKGAGGDWHVFENYPGRKGKVITHATYKRKYLAVLDAQLRAHS